jgi:hypothetical protein
MKTFVTDEKDVEQHKEPFPEGTKLIHFKLVGIGANTMGQANHLGHKICEVVRTVPGFFIVHENSTDVRAALHDLVDRFCNQYEGKNEPTQQKSE